MSNDASNRAPKGVPRHVAIIMDGNGRWAKKRLLPRIAGHRAGVETVRQVVRACGEKGVEVLTLFAFSSKNKQQPKQKKNQHKEQNHTTKQQKTRKLHENNVRLKVVGER